MHRVSILLAGSIEDTIWAQLSTECTLYTVGLTDGFGTESTTVLHKIPSTMADTNGGLPVNTLECK